MTCNSYRQLKKLTLDEHREVLIHILDEVDRFCRDNGIHYSLAYGTLLGAVRHKGFIPWDDDIDIIMSRADYRRFISEFDKNRDDKLRVFSYENDPGYYLLSAKVCDMRTLLIEAVDDPIELGVYIDIFINDYLSSDIWKAGKIVRRIKRERKLLQPSTIRDRSDRLLYKKALLALIRTATKPFTREGMLRRVSRIAQKYSSQPESVYCGSVTSLYYNEKEIMKTSWWEEGTVELEFEGRKYKASKHYHEILTQLYGDYMTPPPPDKQNTHHAYEAYWR